MLSLVDPDAHVSDHTMNLWMPIEIPKVMAGPVSGARILYSRLQKVETWTEDDLWWLSLFCSSAIYTIGVVESRIGVLLSGV